MAHSKLQYRPEIQGLRAIAVVPIVLFHAGITALPGGYLGVDIFFVISGFLITRIIWGEMEERSFSFLGFYKRRAIRIFPALLVMLAITTAACARLLLPAELSWNALSSAAAAVFGANVYFWRNVGYFQPASETFVYLHTWSLGVEEQFYLFYPVFLLALHKWLPRLLKPAIILTIVASFILALLVYRGHPEAAFYLLPTRAWQLGLGAAIALGIYPRIASALARKIIALAALAAIAIAYVFIDSTWQIPAPWALVPSLATALIIAYGETGPATALLSIAPMRWFGAISYSLYLWHWPIITLYRIQFGMKLQPMDTVWLVIGSVLAGAMSFALIEQPFMRRYRNARSGPAVIVGTVAIVATAAALFLVTKMPERWSPYSAEALRVARFMQYNQTAEFRSQFRPGVCFATWELPTYDEAMCSRSDPAKRTIVLIGDSHAAHYYLAIQRLNPDANVIQATASGCRVLVGAQAEERCQKMIGFAYGPLLDKQKIDRAVLAGHWHAEDLPYLLESIAVLRKREIPVTVIGPVEEFDRDFPRLLATSVEFGSNTALERERMSEPRDIEQDWQQKVKDAGADYYSVIARECPNGKCLYTTPKGDPIHFDTAHVTQSGAEMLLSGLNLQ